MYRVLITKRALKDLEKTDANTKARIGDKIKLLINDPISNSKKLSASIIGTYRFRVGDYRIIFDIDEDKIIVLRIGHRKDIYK
jgi:mRNA interferase RelE/StbE